MFKNALRARQSQNENFNSNSLILTCSKSFSLTTFFNVMTILNIHTISKIQTKALQKDIYKIWKLRLVFILKLSSTNIPTENIYAQYAWLNGSFFSKYIKSKTIRAIKIHAPNPYRKYDKTLKTETLFKVPTVFFKLCAKLFEPQLTLQLTQTK